MAVWFASVLVGLGVVSLSPAQTNDWFTPTRGYWDDYTKWSLGVAPTNEQTVYITNDASKTVTIDDFTSSVYPETLTVSNLFLSAPAGVTNTLELVSSGTTKPLSIFDTLNVSSGGLLYLSNAALVTRSLTNTITNCFFSVDGTVVLDSNSVLLANSGFFLGVDSNSTGSVFIKGGQLLLQPPLSYDPPPTNTSPVSAIGVNGSGQLTISKGEVLQTSSVYVFVGSGTGSQGTLTLAGGSYVSSAYDRLVVGMETGATGVVSVNSGTLLITNSLITLVGGDGSGQLNLQAGNNILGTIEVGGNSGAAGIFNVSGGVNTLQGPLIIADSPGATGTLWLAGGQIIQTNTYLASGLTNYLATLVGSHGVGTLNISNGNWYGGAMVVGVRSNSLGTVNFNGGTMTLLSKLSLGSWSNSYGEFHMNGGSLYVTNSTSSASLVVGGPAHPVFPITNCNDCAFPGWNGNGALIQNGGTVTADQLVMTNGADGVYAFNAGTLQTKATTVSGSQTFIVFTIPTNVTSSTIITNPQTFVVGDGIQSATFRLLGGIHTFVNDLKIRTNSFLTGCGTINGNVLVEGTVLADCGGTLVFTGAVTNNSTMRAVNGTTLEFFGPVINNGFIDVIGGNTNFHAGVINNGIILDADGDYDGDGMSNLQESLAGTDPTNSASYFHFTSILAQGNDILVVWSAVTNESYVVQACTNSLAGGFTNDFADLGTVTVPAAPVITETNYLDVGAVTNVGTRFYRIKVVTP